MPFVESVDGVKLFYEVIGEGDIPLVMVPGLGGWDCKVMWKFQLPLAEKFKLVISDLAGHGQSDKDRERYTMELFGQDIKAIVEQLDLTNIILVGQSLGGAIIVEAAKLMQKRVKGLICVDTLLFPMYLNPSDEEAIKKAMEPYEEDFLKAFNELLENHLTDDFNPEALEMFQKYIPTLDKRSINNIFSELLRWNGTEALKSIDVPLKFIFAGRSIQNAETREEMAKDYDVEFLEGVGHLLMLEDPDAFNEILEKRIKDFDT
ncbi:MAG: alpha/beta hydrolase [Asgard group archaeon]|nr:alpha/beta hydrolase [Asgard group archaeon]